MVLKATWQVLLAIDKRLNWPAGPAIGFDPQLRTARGEPDSRYMGGGSRWKGKVFTIDHHVRAERRPRALK